MSNPPTKSPAEANGSKAWDDDELRACEALDYGKVKKATLKNEPHKIFAWERWEGLSRADYDVLLPSIRLASLLLEVCMVFFTDFLPSDPLHEELKNIGAANRDPMNWDFQLTDESNITKEDLDKAEAELDEIAGFVTWQANYGMFINKGWQGITRLARTDPRLPWDDLYEGEAEAAASKAIAAGLKRRPLIVGIMREYIDAMKRFPEDDEAHLRAKFLCAYTMIHEIGHVVWAQDFRSNDYSKKGREPFLGDDARAELGSAFTSRLFSGYDPNLRSSSDIPEFEKNLIWSYRPKKTEERPLYTKEWAIPIPYMEDILSQSSWDALRQYKGKEFSSQARERFKPDLTSLATKASREWIAKDLYSGKPKLKTSRELDRRPQRTNLNISKQEIEMEEEFERLNPEPSRYKDPEEEDDVEELGGFNADEEAARLKILPQREIWDGVVRTTSASGDNGYISVEVRYRPDNAYSSRRRDNDQVSYDKEDPAEVAVATADQEERFGNEKYDCRNIDELLANKKPHVVAKMTMRAAYNYCKKHGITFPLKPESNSTWGSQTLDVNVQSHRELIERIRLFAFLKAEERFKNDNSALIKIKEERRKAVDKWGDEDIRDWLMANGIPNIHMRHKLIDRIKRRINEDISRIAELLPKPSPRPAQLRFPRRSAMMEKYQPGDAAEDWGEEDFEAFFRSHNVPALGTRGTQCLRIERFWREVHFLSLDRSHIHVDARGPVQRLRNGVEVYRFGVAIQGTTVEMLKEKLFLKAIFPANAIMHFRFGTDRRHELQDDQLLSVYRSEDSPDWKDVWVDLTFPEEPSPDPDKEEEYEPLVYKPRNPRPDWGDEDEEDMPGYDPRYPPGDPDSEDEDNVPLFRSNALGPSEIGNPDYTGPAGHTSGLGNDDGGEVGGASGGGIEGASSITAGSGKSGRSGGSGKRKADDYDDEFRENLKRKKAILRRREADGTFGDPREKPNLGERLAMLTSKSSALNKAFKPGGGHDSPLNLGGAKEQKSLSAAELLDNLEDLEEDEKAREQRIYHLTQDSDDDLIINGSRNIGVIDLTGDDDEDDDRGLAPRGAFPSHMRDLYKNVPKRPGEY